MSSLEHTVDWLFQRRRCIYCTAPYPLLKCTGFNAWQCPSCETDFSLDAEGDLEASFHPEFEQQLQQSSGRYEHFPSSPASSSSLLCPQCTLNQQKIIQLLHSFEPESRRGNTQKQYEIYVAKLESRYPLCTTCSYRVSVHLKDCQERALSFQRQNLASRFGSNWRDKLALSNQMRNSQLKRRLLKGLFFWPEFLFQLTLIALGVLKQRHSHGAQLVLRVYEGFEIWAPQSFSFSSSFFVILLSLTLIQVVGIFVNGHGWSPILLQLFLLASRIAVGNFLFNFSDSPIMDLSTTLMLTSIGLAMIVNVGGNNGDGRKQFRDSTSSVFTRNATLSKSSARPTNSPASPVPALSPMSSSLLSSTPQVTKKSKGFADYSETQYRYHSFANQLTGNTSIMPWPDKPLPGNLNINRRPPHVLISEASPGSSPMLRLRPAQLNVEDSLELEPMFSSFSLNDDSKSAVASGPSKTLHMKNVAAKVDSPLKPNVSVSFNKKVSYLQQFRFVYNLALSLGLLILRVTLEGEVALISVVMGAAFGLRGFVWSRLAFKWQICTVALILVRLLWIAAELVKRQDPNHNTLMFSIIEAARLPALFLDLVLIVLR